MTDIECPFCQEIAEDDNCLELHLIEEHYLSGDEAPKLVEYMKTVIPISKIEQRIKELEEYNDEKDFIKSLYLHKFEIRRMVVSVLKDLLPKEEDKK